MYAKKRLKEACICERCNFQFDVLNLVIDYVFLGKQCLKGWEHCLNKWQCNINEQKDTIADKFYSSPLPKYPRTLKRAYFLVEV